MVGRLGLTGQGHTAEPVWYCLGRRLGLGVVVGKRQGRAGEVDLGRGNGRAQSPGLCDKPEEGKPKVGKLGGDKGSREDSRISLCFWDHRFLQCPNKSLLLSLSAPVLLPPMPPHSTFHLSPALLQTEDNRPLLLFVISEYTFLITEKWQHQGWLYNCPSMSSCI